MASDEFVFQCSACGRENSVAGSDVSGRNRCACGALLVASNCLPQEVTDAEWEAQVLGSGVPVVAYFWGPNCGVCANYTLSVRKMAASFCGLARVVTLDVEANPKTPARYGLKGVPTVMIFSRGELARTMEGPQGARGIREILEGLGQNL